MTDCAGVLAALFLGRPLDAPGRAHLAVCAHCQTEETALARVAGTLAADPAPPVPPGLGPRVLRAATPLLARNARRAARPALVRAVAVALLPLPLIVLLDAFVLRTAHALLSAVLPPALSTFVVFNYVALLALLFALTYGAVPILAAHQLRGLAEESHA
jgi:hypothetical protein